MIYAHEIDRVAAIDAIIVKHLGRSDFADAAGIFVWANLILDAARDSSLFFGKAPDSEVVADLLRASRQTRLAISKLSESTRAKVMSNTEIWRLVSGKGDYDLVAAAESILTQLEDVVGDLSKSRPYRVKATKSRNWEAAAVAGVCGIIWGTALLERAGGRLPASSRPNWIFARTENVGEVEVARLQRQFYDQARELTPTSEKHYKPGPFGRFIEDIFEAIGVIGKDGNPFPAASALRSLKEAGKQFSQT